MLAAEGLWHWSLQEPTAEAAVGTRRVVLEEMPRLRKKTWTARATLIGPAADTLHGRSIMLTAMLRETTPSAGDVLLLHCALEPPRDTHNPREMAYGTWLRRHGVCATAFCPAGHWRRVGTYSPLPLRLRLSRWRTRLVDLYADHLQGTGLGVLAAMTLGDRHLLDADTRRDFAAVGASHVLALSGLHLGILVALYVWSVLRLVRRWRWGRAVAVGGGLVLMATFVLLVGAPLSLVRAELMFIVALICSLMERRGLSLNNLSLAALLILLYDPRSLFDAGFQLSFCAVAAIVGAVPLCRFPRRWARHFPPALQLKDAAYERLARSRMRAALLAAPDVAAAQRIRLADCLPDCLPWPVRWHIRLRVAAGELCRWLWGLAVMSLAAQVGTLPLVVWHFHTLPVWGLLLSFVVIPLAYLILLFAVLFFVLVPLRPLVAMALKGLLAALVGSVSGVADLPGGHLRWEWEEMPPFVIYSRPAAPEIYCPEGQWHGALLFSPYGRVARVDGRRPSGRPHRPIGVDYLWLCRGSKGSLADWLHYYAPRTVVLDASLTPYYYARYRHEADSLRLPLYDVQRQGALAVRDKVQARGL